MKERKGVKVLCENAAISDWKESKNTFVHLIVDKKVWSNNHMIDQVFAVLKYKQ